jgi:hypothetical protein
MWFPALWVHVGFLSRCLILLNGRVSRRSIFGFRCPKIRPAFHDFRRNKLSRTSGIAPAAGRRYAYRPRISLPFGINIDRLSPMLGLARAVEGINSCLVVSVHRECLGAGG